jgi:hypothetical protein
VLSSHTRCRPAVLLLALAGCRLAPPPAPTPLSPVEVSIALPLPTAAAIAGGALRAALPFSDPAREEPGILVQRLGPDRLRLALHQRATGGWSPIGDHRLALALGPADGDGVPALQHAWRAVPFEPGTDAIDACAWLELREHGAVTTIAGALPAALWTAVTRALLHAATPDGASPSLGEGNLERFLVHRLAALAAAAAAAGDRDRARTLRWRAASSAAAPPCLEALLGDEDAAGGDGERAAERYWLALALTRDPAERARAGQRLAAIAGSDPAGQRRTASLLLRTADPTAQTWLHSARAEAPEPIEDYGLLSQFHHRRGNPQRARASALLAREHAAARTALAPFAAALWQQSGPPFGTPQAATTWLTTTLAPAMAPAAPPR